MDEVFRLRKWHRGMALFFPPTFLAWVVVALVGPAAHEHFRPGLKDPDPTLIAGSVAWFGVLLFEAFRVDRRQSRRAREAADLAAKDRGEPAEHPWASE